MCDEYAECNDTIGSYTCACNDGFSGNGFLCEGEGYYHSVFW